MRIETAAEYVIRLHRECDSYGAADEPFKAAKANVIWSMIESEVRDWMNHGDCGEGFNSLMKRLEELERELKDGEGGKPSELRL